MLAAGSFQSHPSSGTPHLRAFVLRQLCCLFLLKEGTQKGTLSFSLAVLPCPPSQTFFSQSLVVAGQDYEPGSSASIQSMGGNVCSSSQTELTDDNLSRFRRGMSWKERPTFPSKKSSFFSLPILLSYCCCSFHKLRGLNQNVLSYISGGQKSDFLGLKSRWQQGCISSRGPRSNSNPWLSSF